MHKKNILLLISALFIGGAERVVANLAKYLNESLFNISICHLKGRGEIGQELQRDGFDIFAAPKSGKKRIDYLSFIKLRRLLIEKEIDLIHSHGTAALVEGSLCRIITPAISHVHTFHFGNYPHYNKADKKFEKIFWRVPDRLIAVGNEQKKAIQETYGIPSHRIGTIWNGVDTPDFIKNADGDLTAFKKHSIVIGSISTLIEQKGITFLLDAAAELNRKQFDFIILIVGDGPLRSLLEEKTKDLNLTHKVRFLGWIKNAAKTVLPQIDIFVQPSLWEAMSMVPLEAMAAARPVVVTDVGENRYVVEHERTGLVVPSKDVAGLANCLERLIGDAALRKRFGKAAKERYDEFFRAEVMAKNYEELYLEELNNNRHR